MSVLENKSDSDFVFNQYAFDVKDSPTHDTNFQHQICINCNRQTKSESKLDGTECNICLGFIIRISEPERFEPQID